MLKCELCGGSILVNPDTAVGVCDSCGNTVEISQSVVLKSKSILRLAEQKMLSHSSKGYEEAIRLLESIEDVNGVREKIEYCRGMCVEMKKKEADRRDQEKKNDSRSTGIGILIAVLILAAALALIGGIVFAVYKVLSGGLTGTALYVTIGVLAVSLLALIGGRAANH